MVLQKSLICLVLSLVPFSTCLAADLSRSTAPQQQVIGGFDVQVHRYGEVGFDLPPIVNRAGDLLRAGLFVFGLRFHISAEVNGTRENFTLDNLPDRVEIPEREGLDPYRTNEFDQMSDRMAAGLIMHFMIDRLGGESRTGFAILRTNYVDSNGNAQTHDTLFQLSSVIGEVPFDKEAYEAGTPITGRVVAVYDFTTAQGDVGGIASTTFVVAVNNNGVTEFVEVVNYPDYLERADDDLPDNLVPFFREAHVNASTGDDSVIEIEIDPDTGLRTVEVDNHPTVEGSLAGGEGGEGG